MRESYPRAGPALTSLRTWPYQKEAMPRNHYRALAIVADAEYCISDSAFSAGNVIKKAAGPVSCSFPLLCRIASRPLLKGEALIALQAAFVFWPIAFYFRAMITGIKLTKLRNAEHFQFMSDVLTVVRMPALQCEEHVAALASIVSEMHALSVSDPSSAQLDEIASLDDIRDDLIIGIAKLCEAHTYNPDASIRAAALTLSRDLEHYGSGIAMQSHNVESATITSILKDWRAKQELHSATNLLGMDQWLTALETANNNFVAKYMLLTDLANNTHDQMKTKRQEANKVYNELLERIDGFYTINNLTGPWEDVINKLNDIIGQYNKLLKDRAGSPSNTDGLAFAAN